MNRINYNQNFSLSFNFLLVLLLFPLFSCSKKDRQTVLGDQAVKLEEAKEKRQEEKKDFLEQIKELKDIEQLQKLQNATICSDLFLREFSYMLWLEDFWSSNALPEASKKDLGQGSYELLQVFLQKYKDEKKCLVASTEQEAKKIELVEVIFSDYIQRFLKKIPTEYQESSSVAFKEKKCWPSPALISQCRPMCPETLGLAAPIFNLAQNKCLDSTIAKVVLDCPAPLLTNFSAVLASGNSTQEQKKKVLEKLQQSNCKIFNLFFISL